VSQLPTGASVAGWVTGESWNAASPATNRFVGIRVGYRRSPGCIK